MITPVPAPLDGCVAKPNQNRTTANQQKALGAGADERVMVSIYPIGRQR
jgi:hypothetical protein